MKYPLPTKRFLGWLCAIDKICHKFPGLGRLFVPVGWKLTPSTSQRHWGAGGHWQGRSCHQKHVQEVFSMPHRQGEIPEQVRRHGSLLTLLSSPHPTSAGLRYPCSYWKTSGDLGLGRPFYLIRQHQQGPMGAPAAQKKTKPTKIEEHHECS